MNSTNVYNDTIMSQSQVVAAKDEKRYTLTLTADQRKLLMYSGAVIGGYFLLRSLINATVKKIQRDE